MRWHVEEVSQRAARDLPDNTNRLRLPRLGDGDLGAANTYFATADTAEAGVPTILFGLLIPLAVAAIALWRSESIARLVSAIPLHWLVAAQVYRVARGRFRVLWADGRQPWARAVPAGGGGGVQGGRARGCA